MVVRQLCGLRGRRYYGDKMRLDDYGVNIGSHNQFLDIGPNDHHTAAESFTVIENGQSLTPGTHNYDISLNSGNHKLVRMVIRGPTTTGGGGYLGVIAVGTDSQQESHSIALAYMTYVYASSFSRMHGDTKLSRTIFGTSIRLLDVFLLDSTVRLVFENIHSTENRTLTFYGTGIVK